MINTACMYLSEALSKHLPSSYPRLHSLRSLSLGLLRNSLFEAISHCDAWRMGITPHPYIGYRREDGDKPHPYIVFRREHADNTHPYIGFHSTVFLAGYKRP